MPITIGVNFRHTLAFVSGGASGNGGNANYKAEITGAGADYPVSFGGTTIGWEDSFAIPNGRDYDSGIDVRLAGIMFNDSANVSTVRIDLPLAGTYGIQLAVGSAYGPLTNGQVLIKDNTTTLATISGSTGGALQWYGADNTNYTSAASWAAANTVDGGGAAQISLAFSSTIARFTIGNGTNSTGISHIFITGPVVTGFTPVLGGPLVGKVPVLNGPLS